MTEIDVDSIHDEHDLAAALALALRDAQRSGDKAWESELHATLSQAVHVLGLDLREQDAVSPAIVLLNGRLDLDRIRTLLRV